MICYSNNKHVITSMHTHINADRDGIPQAFSELFPWMKKSLNNFLGLPYWSLIMACYVCSSGKPFLTAPVRIHYSFLCVRMSFFHPLLEHLFRRPCLKMTLHLFRPLDYDILKDRVFFFFLSLYHPQHLEEFLIHHRGSINACWIELPGFALRGHLFQD